MCKLRINTFNFVKLSLLGAKKDKTQVLSMIKLLSTLFRAILAKRKAFNNGE